MSGRDYSRVASLNTLINVLNMAKSEEIELRDIAKLWQKNGGLLMFDQQIALIQRNAASRSHIKFFIYRLKLLNKEIFSKYPKREYLILCVICALDALQDAIGESSYLREQVKNQAINAALQSTASLGGSEQYFSSYYDENENEDEDEDYKEKIDVL